MSQDTSSIEPVVAEAAAEEAQQVTITVAGKPVKAILDASKRRNSEEKIYKLRPVIDPSESIQFLSDILVEGGVNPAVAINRIHAKIYQEIVRAFAAESMEGTFSTAPDENGEPTTSFDEARWIKNFAGLFEEGSRRSSGPTKKQLEDQSRQLGERLAQLLTGADGNPGLPAPTSPEYLELARVTSELARINTLIHNKEGARAAKPRKPRKPKAVAAPVAEPAAV